MGWDASPENKKMDFNNAIRILDNHNKAKTDPRAKVRKISKNPLAKSAGSCPELSWQSLRRRGQDMSLLG
jgi:hypothetical protein